VIGLYIAFALPIILRIKAGDKFEPGAWSLGRHYKWVSWIAVVWIGAVCVLFLMPISPNGIPGAAEFAWESVNYAPLTVGGALLLFGGWYVVSARKWFTGPVREEAADAELAAILGEGSHRPAHQQQSVPAESERQREVEHDFRSSRNPSPRHAPSPPPGGPTAHPTHDPNRGPWNRRAPE
jgi:hypothetical protein